MDGDAAELKRARVATFAGAGAIAALAVGLVLLCTNHGVGLAPESLRIIEHARPMRFAGPSPVTSAIDGLLVTPKRDPATAFRWPGAILLALTVLMAAHAVYFLAPRHVWPAVLTGALVASLQPVLHAFTVLRPEAVVTLTSLACLALAADFARTRNVLLAFGSLAFLLISGMSYVPACTLAVGAAVAVGAGWRIRGAKFAWGHAAFAVLYAVTASLWFHRQEPGVASPVILYAPSIAAAAVFLGSIVTQARGRIAMALFAAVVVASAAFSTPWIVRAQRDGHDFATRQNKHSDVISAVHALGHSARDAVFYSNVPEVLALYDHHVSYPLPRTGDERADFAKRLATQSSFVVWFDGYPGSVADLNAIVPLEQYREVDGGALYRADATVWAGGRRLPPYRTDTAYVAARRSAGNFPWWNDKHEGYVRRAAKGGVDLLFLGDSITDDYRKIDGAWDFFEQRYGPYHPANFGIDGDRTQHLLWRILNGECDGSHIAPRVAVILIGTNNTAEDSPESIAKGIEACVTATRAKLPTTRVLLLGLFPRGGSAVDNDKRKVILRINQLLPKLDNGDSVRFLNLYDKFLEPDGTLTKDVMYDGLHPSLRGYHIWADAMQPLLDGMMRAPPLAK